MNNTSKEELSEVFVEVRKAYRLLYFYQQRVLDTVKYISDYLTVNVHSGWSVFSGQQPRNGARINLDNWAWDWLNMYMYEFYIGKTQDDSGNDYQFAIQVQADTGCYDNLDEEINETDVANYSVPELAKTQILFMIGKNRWKSESKPDPNNYIYFHDIPALKGGNDCTFIEINEDQKKLFILKSYALENFVDEGSIKLQIDDFITFAESNGISILKKGKVFF